MGPVELTCEKLLIVNPIVEASLKVIRSSSIVSSQVIVVIVCWFNIGLKSISYVLLSFLENIIVLELKVAPIV